VVTLVFAVYASSVAATAYLSELHLAARSGARSSRAGVAATAANLGGIGIGSLLAGLLVQYAPAPFTLSYVVFGGALVLPTLAVRCFPETVRPRRCRAIGRSAPRRQSRR
jgi:MFS family permease